MHVCSLRVVCRPPDILLYAYNLVDSHLTCLLLAFIYPSTVQTENIKHHENIS